MPQAKKMQLLKAVLAFLVLVLLLVLVHRPARSLVVNYQVDTRRETAFNENGILVAHRGVSAVYPENTIPAFQLAGIRGYQGAECDISLTKDGQWVLMHDATVDRTTDGQGAVASMTLAEVQELTIQKGSGIRFFTNLRVPTLEEYLQVCAQYKMAPFIELKTVHDPTYLKNLIDLLSAYGLEEWAVILSFHYDLLEKIREISKVQMVYLHKKPNRTAIDRAAALSACELGIEYKKITNALLAYAKSKEVLTYAYTVDDEKIYADLTEKGVNYIVTNALMPRENPQQDTVDAAQKTQK